MYRPDELNAADPLEDGDDDELMKIPQRLAASIQLIKQEGQDTDRVPDCFEDNTFTDLQSSNKQSEFRQQIELAGSSDELKKGKNTSFLPSIVKE